MITYVQGNIFESPATTLVNTVNTVGVMGRGIAAEFKRLYPEMFKEYRELCERKQIKIGTLWLYPTDHKSVLNFPTKDDWRRPSKPEYIEEGLKTFLRSYERAGIHSVAFPALGCGNGGLDFDTQVQPLMEKYLKRTAANVFIYPHRQSAQLPEHRDVAAMKRWLHTAPEELSFCEVWDDLRVLLGRKHVFHTFKQHSQFWASLQEKPEEGLRIVRGNSKSTSFIPYEDLVDFWQQLRAFGFTSSRSAPSNRARDTSYIAPIFASLDYVQPVRIAEAYGDPKAFEREAEYALQIIPRIGRDAEEPELDLRGSA